MGIGIILEDERGARIGSSEVDDVHNTLLQLLARAERAQKQLKVLNYVDPYGNTVLNAPQQEAALVDLEHLHPSRSAFTEPCVCALEQEH